MVSNKILTLDAVFNLPDDFEGTWREAVMLYAEYVKNQRETPGKFVPSEGKSLYTELMNDKDSKHATKVTVQKWTGKGWEDILKC